MQESVLAILFDDDRKVLTTHSTRSGWSVPGGLVHDRAEPEELEAAVTRHVYHQTGLRVVAAKLLLSKQPEDIWPLKVAPSPDGWCTKTSGSVMVHIFVVRVSAESSVSLPHGSSGGVRWATPDETDAVPPIGDVSLIVIPSEPPPRLIAAPPPAPVEPAQLAPYEEPRLIESHLDPDSVAALLPPPPDGDLTAHGIPAAAQTRRDLPRSAACACMCGSCSRRDHANCSNVSPCAIASACSCICGACRNGDHSNCSHANRCSMAGTAPWAGAGPAPGAPDAIDTTGSEVP